jgi:hypothetical protein
VSLFKLQPFEHDPEPADDSSEKNKKKKGGSIPIESDAAAANAGREEERFGKQTQKCAEVIGELTPGSVVHYVSAGDWSMHNLLYHILKQVGPAEVFVASWSITEPGCRRVLSMIDERLITKVEMVFDWRVRVRNPAVLHLAKSNFGTVKLANCHAKVTALRNDNFQCAIVGSANYTNNPRIEAGVIDCTPQGFDFHRRWIRDLIEKSDPFEMNVKKLEKVSAMGKNTTEDPDAI